MWLIIYWLLGLPSLLFHGLVSLAVLVSLICYKIFNSPRTIAAPLSTCCRNQVALTQEQLKSRLQSLVQQAKSSNVIGRVQQQLSRNRNMSAANLPTTNKSGHVALLASLLLVCLSAGLIPSPAACLEQDAQILLPVADLAKGIIKTATLGVPLDVNFNPSGLVKNFAYFTWRTGFPVTMPSGFMQKVQDFYNRVRFRVNQADVKDVERKSLVGLRGDLDEIVDSIVEQVRESRDGLYTDYLQTRVNGLPLEDACTNVGIQLKAYGVDLANYRNIAGAVLGIPVMPTVASTVMDVAGFARDIPHLRLANLTQLQMNSAQFLTQLPGGALNSVVSASNNVLTPIDNLRRQLNPSGMVSGPLGSIFNQAFKDPNLSGQSSDKNADALAMVQPVY